MRDQGNVDKETFKQIFRDWWDVFLERYPRYEQVSHVIQKMLGCGDPAIGYSEYICPECLETIKIPFSCKCKFCLSCAKAHLDEWISRIEASLFDGVDYRHLILTVPEQLRNFFYKDAKLLDGFIKTGLVMIKDVLDTYFGDSMEVGYIVVLQTAGRSASYNPHLHIMMTAGGELIDKLYRQCPKGIVAHIKMEVVPKKDKLANYLIKYVGSPPIALSRIVEYDRNHGMVTYWYKDHRTHKKEQVKVDVLQFIGRMVQHILPKGFKQVRYYGLHATCKVEKIRELLKEVLSKAGRVVKEVTRTIKRYSYREGIKRLTGKDPSCCKKCQALMWLFYVWHADYGLLYDGSKKLEAVTYDVQEDGSGLGTRRAGTSDSRNRGRNVLQLSLSPVWV